MQPAIQEILQGLKRWDFWGFWGWQDIRQRYRRSSIGPLWLTLSMALFVCTLGVVYSRLFNMDMHDYLPFLAAGYLVWFFISNIVNEGCATIQDAGNYLKDIKLPFSLFTARIVWRNFIILLHNFIVYFGVIIYFQFNPGMNILWLFPGLIILLANSLWIAFFLGMVGARYRDIPPIVASILQILFFVTPIAWQPHLLGNDSSILKYNLAVYFLDLFRSPLLGKVPALLSWYVTLGTLLVGVLLSVITYAASRKKIVFWI